MHISKTSLILALCSVGFNVGYGVGMLSNVVVVL